MNRVSVVSRAEPSHSNLTHSRGKPLIIFELANNHEGLTTHANKIIDGLAEHKRPYESLFDFALKFQFRNLETFIDPEADPGVNKHIARFRSNQLTEPQWAELTEKSRANGFIVITTPFDEASIDQAIRLGITTLKIASCSAQEWSLIQTAARAGRHLIVSTAGLSLDKIDALYSFLRHQCLGEFTILHCVGIYPAPLDSLNLATIRRFIQRYPKARIGYSGHESPSEHRVSTTALALGAEVFERHVGIATSEISLNSYSLDLPDVADWLTEMSVTMQVLGHPKEPTYVNVDEMESLESLRRGVFAQIDIPADREISPDLVCFRFPLRERQADVAEFTTIYNRFRSMRAIRAGDPISEANSHRLVDWRAQNLDRYVQRIRGIATEAHIDLADEELLEISHHYGVEEIWNYGCCIVNVLNRSYCKKLILMAQGQEHPEQFHKIKEETFRVLHGAVQVKLDGAPQDLTAGQLLVIMANTRHSFKAVSDAVIEELSTTSSPEDSYYTDVRISASPRSARKSLIPNFSPVKS